MEAAKVLCEQVESVWEMQWDGVRAEVAMVLCEPAESVAAVVLSVVSVWE